MINTFYPNCFAVCPSFIHTLMAELPYKVSNHQESFGIHCVAQGHFNMWRQEEPGIQPPTQWSMHDLLIHFNIAGLLNATTLKSLLCWCVQGLSGIINLIWLLNRNLQCKKWSFHSVHVYFSFQTSLMQNFQLSDIGNGRECIRDTRVFLQSWSWPDCDNKITLAKQ